LASDPALRREVGREAEARVQSRYSLQLAADRYSMLYRELATSQEPRWEDFTIAMR
jgi:glycosyltransferase involved in cell wall biosynthesis